jgi:2-polyprenyl-3-methyl-5-hydroxy-6-metoxy-1,4-benzoquinol methylase
MKKIDRPRQPNREADERLKASRKMYSDLVHSTADLQVLVGRKSEMKENEPFIFEDIKRKLALQRNEKVLSIGVGCGQLATYWVQCAAEMKLSLYLNDFPDVLEQLASALAPVGQLPAANVEFIGGAFPADTADSLAAARFDCIDMYSVVHYTDQPRSVIAAAVELLRPGGRLLVGDIPNLDKKGRFLSNRTGRVFEAKYRGVPVEQIPTYGNHRDFATAALAEGQTPLTDAFVADLMTTFREKGYDVYVLNQPATLPFCHTREDMLIVAPHE